MYIFQLKETGFDCRRAIGMVYSSLGSRWDKDKLPATAAFKYVLPVPFFFFNSGPEV